MDVFFSSFTNSTIIHIYDIANNTDIFIIMQWLKIEVESHLKMVLLCFHMVFCVRVFFVFF